MSALFNSTIRILNFVSKQRTLCTFNRKIKDEKYSSWSFRLSYEEHGKHEPSYVKMSTQSLKMEKKSHFGAASHQNCADGCKSAFCAVSKFWESLHLHFWSNVLVLVERRRGRAQSEGFLEEFNCAPP